MGLLVPERLVKHACAALVVTIIPFVAPRALHAASIAAPAPIAVDGAVQVSAVLQRDPAGPMYTERPAQTIRVVRGDTLDSLAATLRSDAAAMRWANNLVDVAEPAVGAPLLVPPGPGALVELTRATSPSRLAAQLGLDPRVILDYNTLRSDEALPAGRWLQVPRAIAGKSALPSEWVVPDAAGMPSIASRYMARGHNLYPYGQCTYYVASRRNVNWAGDARSWLANGRSAGRPVGQVPVVGAIMVSWDSWVGHVAYVERVNLDGSFVVSEWNVRGWAVYDQRTIVPGKTSIIGFVY